MNGIYPDPRRGTYRVYVGNARGKYKFLGSFKSRKKAVEARNKHQKKRGPKIHKGFPILEGAQDKIQWLKARFPERIIDKVVEEAIFIAKRQRKSLQTIHIDVALSRHNELLDYYESDSK